MLLHGLQVIANILVEVSHMLSQAAVFAAWYSYVRPDHVPSALIRLFVTLPASLSAES